MKKTEETKKYAIYALYHKMSDSVFVHYSTEKSVKYAYKYHKAGKNRYTKAMFDGLNTAEGNKTRPRIYVLNNDLEKKDCYFSELAWVRFFLDHGFNLINNEYIVKDAHTLRGTALDIYERIKDFRLSDVLSDENEILKNYKSRSEKEGNPDDTKYISAKVTAEERTKVKEKAAEVNMKLSTYIRAAVLNPQIVAFNYDAISRHIKEITEIKEVLYPLVSMLNETRNVYQADISKLISLMESLEKSEKSLIKETRKEWEQFLKGKQEGVKPNDL